MTPPLSVGMKVSATGGLVGCRPRVSGVEVHIHRSMFEEGKFSREAIRIHREADECARRANKPLDSAHLMLAAFLVPSEAHSILTEKRLDIGRLLACLPVVEEEPPETVAILYSTAAQIAHNLGSPSATSAHLLLAVSRLPFSRAARLLRRAGLPMDALRTHAMAHLTDPRLRRAATERMLAEGLLKDPVRKATTKVAGGRRAIFEPIETSVSRSTAGTTHQPTVAVPVRLDDEEEVEFLSPDIEAFSPSESLAGPSESRTEPVVSASYLGPSEDRQGPRGRDEPTDGTWRYALPESRFPILTSLGHNLTLLAEKGLLDPLVGRESDLDKVVDIISKRRSNNPLLLGDPGVGKTALVEGLASLIVSREGSLPALAGKVIIAVSMSDLLAGTGVRGSFEARLKALKEEVLAADRRVILFIDEIHTLISCGVGEGSLDAANDLKGSLARGEFPCIGATTYGEYRRYIQPDQALDRRFEKVYLYEPPQEEADRILAGVAPIYERFHGVHFAPDSLHAAVRLSDRFLADRSLPAKAIDLLDRAGARTRREGRDIVRREDVVKVLSGLVDLPSHLLSVSPTDGLRGFDKALRNRIVGHESSLAVLSRVLAQNWSRFGSRRPLGSFLFAGPRGVGKRTTACTIAEVLFGTPQAFLEIDLADYAEPHAVSHLIGSPPGYVGHEEGGLLSDALTRRPFLAIQWRNVDQAHPSVQSLLAQILSEGTATDRRGRRMDFRNTVHVVIVEDEHEPEGRAVGFETGLQSPSRSKQGAGLTSRYRSVVPADILAALVVVPFSRLSSEELLEIARRQLSSVCRDFAREHGVTLSFQPETLESLAARCAMDARTAGAIETAVTDALLRPAMDFLYVHTVSPGQSLAVRLTEKGLVEFVLAGQA